MAAFFQKHAQMWRISDDFWDDWRLLRQNFILMSIWSGMGRPGAWPDADMLPLGRIGEPMEVAGQSSFHNRCNRTSFFRVSLGRGRSSHL